MKTGITKNTLTGCGLAKATFLAALICFFSIGSLHAQRWMENLNRGVVATKTANNTALVSWRLFGTDPNTLGFNLYRKTVAASAVKLNANVLTAGTNFEDKTANFTVANSYYVTSVSNGRESAASASFTLAANTPTQPFYDVPIPELPNYSVKFIWTGDLNGDGEFDFVYDRQPSIVTDPIVVEAVTSKGQFLWRVDCGPNSVNRYNITPGSSAIDIGHGDGITVYDINNDGKAEVLLKTANGVKFPDGKVVTNTNNAVQYVSVLNGVTGNEISRCQLANDFASVGQLNGMFGIAYLDGVNPSLVWSAKNRNSDKSFNMNVSAYSWVNGAMVLTWKYKRGSGSGPDGHNMRIADVDGDGKDEVIPFGFCLDDNGKILWGQDAQGVVHGDRFFIADMDPKRPGLEGYAIQQNNESGLAWLYYDAKDGKIIHSQYLKNPDGTVPIVDLARGYAGDLDPRFPGYEFFTFTDGIYNVAGGKTSNFITGSYPNLRIWWDGDVLSECLDNGKFNKWNYASSGEGRQYTAQGVYQVGPKTPGLLTDLVGDWREEAIYTRIDNRAIRVFTTPYASSTRIYTMAHNPKYRADMTCKGYYQGNMVDYYLGDGMATPPAPKIKLVGVTAANIAPTISITSPLNNASYNAPASISINATAGDADGIITKVEYYNGATLIGTDNTAPYSFIWSNVGGGTYNLSAKAFDDDATSTTSAIVKVIVTAVNNPPSVSITSPIQDAIILGVPATITINATASDVGGTITKVDFYNGSTLIGTDNTSTYSFIWTNVVAGSYELKAVATDNGGATDTSAVIDIVVADFPRDCNGTANGTALLDKCERCVGGLTGKTACTTMTEAEDACSFDGDNLDTHDGYKGTGFLDGPNIIGAYVKFAVTAQVAGAYAISFLYANGSSAGDRPAQLTVNGIVIPAIINFLPTGTWEEWEPKDVQVQLLQGNNVLELKSTTAVGLSNIDQINYVSAGISAGICPPVLSLNEEVFSHATLLYPNPSTKGFNLQLPDVSEVQVYNMQGVLIDDLGTLNFSQFGDNYNAGVYFVHVKTQSSAIVHRIVKK
ncbi:MAG: T9SS type A sorting domain-containing protein [Opitutaceae bacterium]|nr:T9SS type A sorting domain-containing protein [Cytophagales bacterium]